MLERRVTSIGGPSEMEHQGFISALIGGIVVSAQEAENPYRTSDDG